MVQEGEKRRGVSVWKGPLESWNSISDAYTRRKDEEEHAIELSRINVDLTSI